MKMMHASGHHIGAGMNEVCKSAEMKASFPLLSLVVSSCPRFFPKLFVSHQACVGSL